MNTLLQPLDCFETDHDTIDISLQTGIPGSTAIKLNLPPIDDSQFPTVSILVPTFNRQIFFDLIVRNWLNVDYPRDKLEMIVLDDSTDITDPSILINNGITYHRLNKKHTIGQKRNILANLAKNHFLVHMDDDDWYPSESVAARIRCLLEFQKEIKKPGCIGCSRVLCLDIVSDLMFEAYDKSSLDNIPSTISESTMAYSKFYWELQKWNDNSIYAECLDFIHNRHKTVCTMPSIFVVTQLSHTNNTIQRRVNHNPVSEFNSIIFNKRLNAHDNTLLINLKAKIIKNIPEYRTALDFIQKCEQSTKKRRKLLIDRAEQDILKNNLVIDYLQKVLISKTTSSGRDIVYYCGPGNYLKFQNKWNPHSQDIGGSEEAVINISKYLAKNGFNVTVFCLLDGPNTKYDNVLYRNYWEWIPGDRQDYTIIWRDPSNCKKIINSHKVLLDLHDAINPMWLNDLNENIIIMTKSVYHKVILKLIERPNTYSIPNSIDPSYETNINKRKNILVCTSSPDRCIRALLRALPLIRQRVPDAQIHWAYGFKSGINEGGMENHPSEIVRNWVKETKNIIKNTPGFYNLGRLSQTEVLKLYKKAEIFIYPTVFPEIDCISLSKAMSTGTIPIVTPSGAMSEKMGIAEQIAVNENSLDMSLGPGEIFDKFVDDVVENLLNENKMEMQKSIIRKSSKYYHDEIIQQWLKVLDA